jgi:hypothetical protein
MQHLLQVDSTAEEDIIQEARGLEVEGQGDAGEGPREGAGDDPASLRCTADTGCKGDHHVVKQNTGFHMQRRITPENGPYISAICVVWSGIR